MSGEIDSLSTDLSTDIDNLSTALSTEISSLSTALSGEISSLSTALSGEISAISDIVFNKNDVIKLSAVKKETNEDDSSLLKASNVELMLD